MIKYVLSGFVAMFLCCPFSFGAVWIEETISLKDGTAKKISGANLDLIDVRKNHNYEHFEGYFHFEGGTNSVGCKYSFTGSPTTTSNNGIILDGQALQVRNIVDCINARFFTFGGDGTISAYISRSNKDDN